MDEEKPDTEKPKKSSLMRVYNKRSKNRARTDDEKATLKRRAKAERIQRAIDLFKSGMSKVRIAEELQVTDETIRKWVAGVAKEKPADEPVDVFEANLENVATEAIADERLAARDAEQKALLEVAENQSSPADKYQAYVAASAIKMLRDNLMNVRGPRTIRELSELDQLIRRNLGLNPKGGSGSAGTLTIDISVLNNAKAANDPSTVIIDAD